VSDSRGRNDSVAPTVAVVMSVLLACAIAVIVGLVERPAHASVPSQYHVVHLDTHEYGFTLRPAALPAGEILFIVRNQGTIPHELVMFKTKSADAALPLGKDGSLDEESPQIENVVDSGSALKPGETRWLTAELEPGSYVIVCNLPGHYHAGMHLAVTVP
jgi:uncharacterized cupredoxin-like copper-binding protein